MKKGYILLAVIVIILFLIIVLKPKPAEIQNYQVIDHPYDRIILSGDDANKGFFDPSVEYKDENTGYLVYSSLEQKPENIQFFNIEFIHTSLAKSRDNGKTWTYVKRLTESTSDSIESPYFAKLLGQDSDTIEGEWHNEVPVLVYDPDDSGKQWKLFWHKYFSKDMPNGEERPRILDHSWIMLKEADSPENLDKAEEIKLFSTSLSPGARYNFEEATGLPTAIHNAYTEPGAVYWNGKIYVSLSYFRNDEHTLILVSSSDHGKTWNYVGVILDGKDGFGDYKNFWGAGLAEEQGRLFLLAPPIQKKKDGYLGTYVFEFENIDQARLKRDNDGKLIPYKYFKRSLPGNINSGQADYHKYNTYGGLIMPQADLDSNPRIAQLWSTKENIIG